MINQPPSRSNHLTLGNLPPKSGSLSKQSTSSLKTDSQVDIIIQNQDNRSVEQNLIEESKRPGLESTNQDLQEQLDKIADYSSQQKTPLQYEPNQ